MRCPTGSLNPSPHDDRYHRSVSSMSSPRDTPFTRSDMILPSQDWTSHVVGRISEWINCDSPDTYARANSVEALRQEATAAVQQADAHADLPGTGCRWPGLVISHFQRCSFPHRARLVWSIDGLVLNMTQVLCLQIHMNFFRELSHVVLKSTHMSIWIRVSLLRFRIGCFTDAREM